MGNTAEILKEHLWMFFLALDGRATWKVRELSFKDLCEVLLADEIERLEAGPLVEALSENNYLPQWIDLAGVNELLRTCDSEGCKKLFNGVCSYLNAAGTS